MSAKVVPWHMAHCHHFVSGYKIYNMFLIQYNVSTKYLIHALALILEGSSRTRFAVVVRSIRALHPHLLTGWACGVVCTYCVRSVLNVAWCIFCRDEVIHASEGLCSASCLPGTDPVLYSLFCHIFGEIAKGSGRRERTLHIVPVCRTYWVSGSHSVNFLQILSLVGVAALASYSDPHRQVVYFAQM